MLSTPAKICVISAFILVCCAFTASSTQDVLKADWKNFITWVQQHQKWYLDNSQELHYRYTVWSDNVARINCLSASHANKGTSHRLGLTAHTDLTREEFRSKYLGAPMDVKSSPQLAQQQRKTASPANLPAWLRNRLQQAGAWLETLSGLGMGVPHPLQGDNPQHWRFENVTPPAAVDWRQQQPPVLGAIKDQHVNGTPCGSCWAFSAVSIMEIASAMATGHVVLGSEQQLIDCDRKYDHGCSGGGWLNAIQYTIKNKGIATEEQYPYTGKDGHCNKQLARERHTLKVDTWEDVPFSNETALAQAVSQTPVIVAICVGPALDDWHHYAGGIYDSPCCEQDSQVTLDHGIVVVGYGNKHGVDYWILKNSWGEHWGEKGFMRIRRNYGKHGKCALASYPAMVFRKPLPDGSLSFMTHQYGNAVSQIAAV